MSKQTQALAIDADAINQQIEEAVQCASVEILKDMPAVKQAVALAHGMNALQEALTDDVIRKIFMPLMGSALGFRTDRDSKPANERYGIETVRRCVMEAILRGFRPVGNEFNIIGGNFYGTQEGYDRKVKEYPGLTDLALRPGAPFIKDGGALVPYRATWYLEGVEMEMVCDLVREGEKVVGDERIPVKVNAGMGPDAVHGKAKRKILARIYERVSGVKSYDGDATELEGVTVTTTQNATRSLVERQKERANQKAQQTAPMPESGEEG